MASPTMTVLEKGRIGAVIRKSGESPELLPVAVCAESVPFRSDPVTGKLGRRGIGVGGLSAGVYEPECRP